MRSHPRSAPRAGCASLAVAVALLFSVSAAPAGAAGPTPFTDATVKQFTRDMARVGIATYRPGSRKPRFRVTGRMSPVRLTTDLARSAALGVWSGTGSTGAQLDAMTGSVKLGANRIPVGALVAGWAKAAETPSARLARSMLGQVHWEHYRQVVFPSAVTMLFTSDVALQLPKKAQRRTARKSAAPVARAAQDGPCTAARDFVEGSINRLFDWIGHIRTDHAAIRGFFGDNFVADVFGAAGDVLSTVVNTAIDGARTIAIGISRIPVKLVVEAIAGVAATVGTISQVANAVNQWSGELSVDPNPTAKGVDVGFPGTLTLNVTAPGGNLHWAGWVQNCARLFEFPLPSFTPKAQPVSWNLSAQSPPGLVEINGNTGPLDDNGQAKQFFTTGAETAEVASGPLRYGTVTAAVTVHRKDLDGLVHRVTQDLLRLLPGIVRDTLGGKITEIVTPLLNDLRTKIDKVRDVSKTLPFTVAYHDPPEPRPPAPAPPPPPAAPTAQGHWDGTYTANGGGGTWSADFTQEGNGFSGTITINNSTCVHGGTISGTLEGNKITFGVVQAEQQISFSGTLEGNSMSGTWSKPGADPPCEADSGTFSATRAG